MELHQFHELEERCTQEDMPHCTAACPIHVDVRAIMAAIRKKDFAKAHASLAHSVPFPGIISRICDHPCEQACLRNQCGQGLSIRELELACVAHNDRALPKRPLLPQKKTSVAIVGAGLAGLTAAFYLASKAYRVTVIDAGCRPGGRLTAFSESTLPRAVIDKDLEPLSRLRVQFELEKTVGNHASSDISFDQLLADHDAIFLAPGRGGIADLGLGLELDPSGRLMIDSETLGTSQAKVFAGGSYRHGDSLIMSVSDGKAAMISIDRFLQGASLTAARIKDGPVPTALQTSLEGVETNNRVAPADPEKGYDQDEAMAEAERCLDCQCLECVRLCEYLKHYKSSPRQLARQVFKNRSGVGGHRFNQQMNSCSLCRQCEATCQTGFCMADICHGAREALVSEGKMPPSAFDFALADLQFSNGEAFAMSRHAPGQSQSSHVFYPGCQLAGSAPWQVSDIYAWLREELGAVGLLLGCCGVQAEWAGEKAMFLASLEKIRAKWLELGKPVVITACPTCYMVFKKHLPELTVQALLPLVEKLGLPEKVLAQKPLPKNLRLAIHDSCTTRYESELQDSVRRIATSLGCQVEELPANRKLTQCCGFGGLMQVSNMDLAHQVADRRTSESQLDYLVYCSMCRDNFSQRGKPTYHLLDLLFAGSHGKIGPRPATGWSERHDNRARLKADILKEVWGEDTEGPATEISLKIAPETRQLMEDSLILEADLRDVVAYAEQTGNKLLNRANGHFMASHKPGHVTFWAEYSLADGCATIYDTYCHRLEITGLANRDKGDGNGQNE